MDRDKRGGESPCQKMLAHLAPAALQATGGFAGTWRGD
jgi:hypothetical protein